MRQPSQFGRRLPAAAVAGVWLYHGLWCKVIARCPDQLAVVADLPFVPRRLARVALGALGLVEIALAMWVLSARSPRMAALAETSLLSVMNGGGLLWSRKHIAQPTALLAENAVFLLLVWWTARNDEPA
ncbi:MAG TPA: DoxX-like family protein [Candidatus Limnocylindria bacterium]|nr:DoxX-like family protein [Candidatus Limnocylindria bacterium]